MKSLHIYLILFYLLCLFPNQESFGATSQLWAVSGKNWTPSSRLPDFSFAGYKMGGVSIPDFPVEANVKDFGAIGDGEHDDSDAFIEAIKSIRLPGTVFIPPGRYKITKKITINRSHLALKGAGRNKTLLFFPNSLTDLYGSHNRWNFEGGLISFLGANNSRELTSVTHKARRGSKKLDVRSTATLEVGQLVRLMMNNSHRGTLARHLHGNMDDGSKELAGRRLIDFVSRIKTVVPEKNVIWLERPLRTDVRKSWKPTLFSHGPNLEHVGVSDLALQFPNEPYGLHGHAPGYNAIEFRSVDNCWVQNARITNADNGIFATDATRFCTFTKIRIDSGSRRMSTINSGIALGGHHGILFGSQSQDNYVNNFRIISPFYHDLTVSGQAAGNVFANGSGADLCFDFHGLAPFENLFTNLNLGKGTRMWRSGGGVSSRPHTGVRETFWNIQAQRSQTLPEWEAFELNLVGVASDSNETFSQINDPWIENIPPNNLSPQDIYKAQLDRRRGKQGDARGEPPERGELE